MKYVAGAITAALALASAVHANDATSDSNLDKRDVNGQPVIIQAAAAPCQPQVQVQAAAAAPCQPQLQLQAAAPCQQQAAVIPYQQSQPIQVSQPCQQQAIQPVYVQASQPCAQPIAVQEQYTPPTVIYQQPVYQAQPMVQQQPVYQPVYQPQQQQPIYYPVQPQYEESGGNACYAQIGNGLAGASGRFLRYLMCPWSYFGDCWDEGDNSDNGGGYAPQYAQPQYVPQYAPQYAPQYTQQQPQGQWYYNVVPVQNQNPQNAVLQPVHSSLVPDYGLPNGYGFATSNVITC